MVKFELSRMPDGRVDAVKICVGAILYPIPEGLTPMLKMIFSTGHPENRTFGLGTERKMPGAGESARGQARREVR